jgi:glutamate dehydrogenase
MVRRAVYWFLHRPKRNRNIAASIERLHDPVAAIQASLPRTLRGFSRQRFDRDAGSAEARGLPQRLSERIALLRLMPQVLDIAATVRRFGTEPVAIARLHFELGQALRLDWIREQIEALSVEGHWSAMARGTLRENLGREHSGLVAGIVRRAQAHDFDAALADWLDRNRASVARLKRTLDEMQASKQMDFATLSIALREIGRLQ